jgi:squalene-hopene/tetraprenyl-beta-curcumene cyclase
MKSICTLAILCALVVRGYAAEEAIPKEKTNLSLRNEVKLAIDRGLAWLEKQQQAEDGHWSMPENPALTALPVMALMREPTGRNAADPPESVRKGYAYILSCVQPDGGIYKEGLGNYNTSISLTALSLADDPKNEEVMLGARNYIVRQQAKGLAQESLDGGIGYGPGGTNRQHPDLSNTVMALEALRASEAVAKKNETAAMKLDWDAAIGFLSRTQNLPESNPEPWASDDPKNKGGFVYFPGHSMAGEDKLPDGKVALRSYGSMTYAGLMSFIYADLKKDDPRVQAALDWLQENYTLEENPGMGGEGLYYYYQMMSKALATYGLDELRMKDGKEIDWRTELAKKLLDTQHAEGFWVNESGRWMEKDPVLVTCYAVLALEAIYRTL